NDIDHNKQNSNNPIEVLYKKKLEEILDKNSSSLTPRFLGSSLNDDINIEENDVSFNEITG
ncbi:11096_t:CDS:1, partial [Funneliformis geosporum]